NPLVKLDGSSVAATTRAVPLEPDHPLADLGNKASARPLFVMRLVALTMLTPKLWDGILLIAAASRFRKHQRQIKTAEDALHRLTEARSLTDNKYLIEIVKRMREPVRDPRRLPPSEQPFQSQFMSKQVCQDLLEVITKADESGNLPRIDTQAVLDIYGYAKSQGWEIDSPVLSDTAEFLANSSYNGYVDAVAIMHKEHLKTVADLRLTNDSGYVKLQRKRLILQLERFNVSKLESNQIPLNELQSRVDELSADQKRQANAALAVDPLDTAMEIAHTLADRSFVSQISFFSVLVRALCVRERVADAEWLFGIMKSHGGFKHVGNIYASMMSLYYRVNRPSKAEALFSEFRSQWQAEWSQIQSVRVMPDPVSATAEEWRLKHEDHIENPHVITTGELQAIRSTAADPFYQYSLALLGSEDVSNVVDFIVDAKYREFVAFTPNHFDILNRLVVENDYLDLGVKLFLEIMRGAHIDGGRGIVAKDVIYSEQPRYRNMSRILWALPKAGRWEEAWKIVDVENMNSDTPMLHSNALKALMRIALAKGSVVEAKACAERLRELVHHYPKATHNITNGWLDDVFIYTQRIYRQPVPSGQHPVSELVEALVCSGDRMHGFSMAEWNARLIKYTLYSKVLGNAVRAQVHDELFSIICRHDLLSLLQVRRVALAAVDGVLDRIPQSAKRVPVKISDAALGWKPFIETDMTPSDQLQLKLEKHFPERSDSAFWQCALELIVRETRQTTVDDDARKALLVLKLAFIAQAKIPPSTLTMANQLLLEARLPIVDISTGDLLPEIEQIRRASAHEQFKINNDSSIREKTRWYLACRRRFEIPALKQLTLLVVDLVNHGGRDEWEPIFRDHMPEFLESMCNPSFSSARERILYARSIWSHAIAAYSRLGEIEAAANYYNKIIDIGSFPHPQAAGDLLSALKSSDTPLPVLRANWSTSADTLYGLDPTLPPTGQSPADLVLATVDQEERNEQLAQIGLCMLYGSYRSNLRVTDYFTNTVLNVLRMSGKMGLIRHLFETVAPTAIQSMPHFERHHPSYQLSAATWALFISTAVEFGERALAEHWFKGYRLTALPLFLKHRHAYSPFTDKLSPNAKLYHLAIPYYITPQVWHPRDRYGRVPVPAYNLEEVKRQIEMDRLRELDGLRPTTAGSQKMISIYTCVVEYRDMAKAESLATGILALSQDKILPKAVTILPKLNWAKCASHM
ncbi:hypothetical protein EC988_001524, partial [Linderina pennispora]